MLYNMLLNNILNIVRLYNLSQPRLRRYPNPCIKNCRRNGISHKIELERLRQNIPKET